MPDASSTTYAEWLAFFFQQKVPIEAAMKDTAILDSIKNYYGKVLNSNRDLKTSACCAIALFVKTRLAVKLGSDIAERFLIRP